MRTDRNGGALLGLTMVAAVASGAAAFFALYRLRDDPLPALGEAYRIAAFVQPVPFLAAAVLAIRLVHQPKVLAFTLAAVVLCGGYGWWSLSGLAEVRRTERT